MTTTAAFDDLPELAAVPDFYPAEAAAVRRVGVGLDASRLYKRSAGRRRYLNQLAVANAAKALDGLPAPGESWHGVMAGEFHAFAFVPAILTLAAPATIRTLNVATLGFNESNTIELFDLMDRGQVGACTFLYSTYFRANEPEVTDALVAGLQARGGRVACVRNHAKVILTDTSDGRALVLEMSANLRSCHNAEQYVLTHDRGLLDFHRAWMRELLDKADGVKP